jgi:hypothetical protein
MSLRPGTLRGAVRTWPVAVWVTALGALAACGRGQDHHDRRGLDAATASDEAASAATDDADDTLKFAAADRDGRAADTVRVLAADYANINHNSLRGESVSFWSLPNASAITWLNTPAEVDAVLQFTNLQESVPVELARAAVKRLCADQRPGPVADCLKWAASRAGLVFNLVKPQSQAASLTPKDETNPAYVNALIEDFIDGTYGVLVVRKADGSKHYMGQCVACHSNLRVHQTAAGANQLVVDVRGVPAPRDGLTGGLSPWDLYRKYAAVVSDPSDPFWKSDARLHAAGFVAAQYQLWATGASGGVTASALGASYNLTPTNIERTVKYASIEHALGLGYLLAYASIGSTAVPYHASATDFDGSLADDAMKVKSERVFADQFLPTGGRFAIARAVSVGTSSTTGAPAIESPLVLPWRQARSMIGPSWIDQPSQKTGASNYFQQFAFDYIKSSCKYPEVDPVPDAQYYLAGATTAAGLLPKAFDANLATAWFPSGNPQGVTAANATADTFKRLPRSFIENYDLVSRKYHLARNSYPAPVGPALAPQMRDTDVVAAASYVAANCMGACHVSGMVNVTAADVGGCGAKTVAAWAGSSPCVIEASDIINFPPPPPLTAYSVSTATSNYANVVAAAIGTMSSNMDGILSGNQIGSTALNQGVAHRAWRAPLLRWGGLTPAGLESWQEFLKATPHGARWAALSGKVTAAGSEIMKIDNTYSLKVKNGLIDGTGALPSDGKLPAACDQDMTPYPSPFSGDPAGTTYRCRALLGKLGVTARPLGCSDATPCREPVDPKASPVTYFGTAPSNVFRGIHASIARPAAADVDKVAAYLFGLSVGAVMVNTAASPTTFAYLGFYPQAPLPPGPYSRANPNWGQGYQYLAPGSYATATSVNLAPNVGNNGSGCGQDFDPGKYNCALNSPGAQVWYTTDGSEPSFANGTLFTKAVPIPAGTTTIKARSFLGRWSATSTMAFTFLPPAATPTISLPGGAYTTARSVTLASTTPSAKIYYTLDGSTPTTSSLAYGGAIAISTTTTLRAIAIASGFSASPEATATYTYPPAGTPVFTPAAGTYTAAQSVKITSSSPNAKIYYTTEPRETPSIYSTPYTGPINVAYSQTIKAIAYAPNFSASAVASAAYTITGTVATPTITPPTGTLFSGSLVVAWTTTSSGAACHYTTDGSAPTAASPTGSSVTITAAKTVKVRCTLSGWADSAVAQAQFAVGTPCATPTITPGTGTFTAAQTVTMATTSANATILYTTDGSTPTPGHGTTYTAPFTRTSTVTLKAMCYSGTLAGSAVTTASLTINCGRRCSDP